MVVCCVVWCGVVSLFDASHGNNAPSYQALLILWKLAAAGAFDSWRLTRRPNLFRLWENSFNVGDWICLRSFQQVSVCYSADLAKLCGGDFV